MTLRGRHWLVLWLMLFLGVAAAVVTRQREALLVAQHLNELKDRKTELQGAFSQALKIVVPLALVLTALGAWFLSSLTMRPVNRMRRAMSGVTQKALNIRLPTKGEDQEFVVLIDAYNTMLARRPDLLDALRCSGMPAATIDSATNPATEYPFRNPAPTCRAGFCYGCLSGTQCLAGSSPSACGSGGVTCSVCTGPCTNGVCQ